MSTQRREFLRASLIAGAAPLILPSASWSAPSKNSALRLAQIGCGRMGRGDMKNALGSGLKAGVNARVVAVCDVDATRMAKGKQVVEEFYKEHGEPTYANGVRMISKNGATGVKFITENGWAHCRRGGMQCSDRQLLRRRPEGNEVALYESRSHMDDFLTSARAGKDPICPVEVGHRSNTICVLHHISMKLDGRKIEWDPKTEEAVGDSEVAAMINVPMREPWTI